MAPLLSATDTWKLLDSTWMCSSFLCSSAPGLCLFCTLYCHDMGIAINKPGYINLYVFCLFAKDTVTNCLVKHKDTVLNPPSGKWPSTFGVEGWGMGLG